MATIMSTLTSSFLNLLSTLKPTSKASTWRLLAITFALLNLKALPLVWHLRLFSAILHHLILYPRPSFTTKTGPKALFKPLITTSSTPLLECDYNFHKSNSTYFTDLDISRTRLVGCLCAPVFKHGLRMENGKIEKGNLAVMLGAVACTFKKEIKPFHRFEIWSRVLSWDRKWLFIVSHFVEMGAVKPNGFILQPYRKEIDWLKWIRRRRTSRDKGRYEQNGHVEESRDKSRTEMRMGMEEPPNPAIYATAISKYVFKINRRTMPPELILQSSDLLPPKPIITDDNTTTTTTEPTISHPSSLSPASETAQTAQPAQQPTSSTSSPPSTTTTPTTNNSTTLNLSNALNPSEIWDWHRVEEQRLKGLEIANSLTGLDAAHDCFDSKDSGEEGMALGVFGERGFW